MAASRPEPFPSSDRAAMLLTSPPALNAPAAPVSTTQPTASPVSTWARTVPRAEIMPVEKALRRCGRFMVITATPSLISASSSSVPVSSVVMSSFLAGEADPADHPWPPARLPLPLHWQPGDGHLGNSLALAIPGGDEPQSLARGLQVDGGPVAAARDPEHRGPALRGRGRVLDLDRQAGHAAGGMAGRLPGPGRARPVPRLLRGGPVQGDDGAGDVPGMQVGPGDVGQGGGPDPPHAKGGAPAAGRHQVRDLEYRHVPAVTAAPLEVPPGGRARLDGRHHLHERVTRREYRVGQAELAHPGIMEGRSPAEGAAQFAGHPVAVACHQGHLAQARSGQHTPTLRRRFRRIIGRSGLRRATTSKPWRAKADAVPGNRLRLWPGACVSTGYASMAGAPAAAATPMAASISAPMTPRSRCVRRT